MYYCGHQPFRGSTIKQAGLASRHAGRLMQEGAGVIFASSLFCLFEFEISKYADALATIIKIPMRIAIRVGNMSFLS